jgi:signal transduction histidine kinase
MLTLHSCADKQPYLFLQNTWGGQDDRLVVLSLHNIPDSTSLLYNLYSEEDRGIHVDSMNACANAHNDTETSPACAVFTDMLELKIRPGPAGLLFQPVFPANDPTTFVGFATTSLHWEEALTGIVPDYVNGLTCVVSTDTASFTYEIRSGGVVKLIGDGDLHEERYDEFAESVILTDIKTGASTSAVYTLTVYPTDAMFATFSTNSPLAIAFAFTGVIFLCTLLFFLYDFLMRHEAEQRKLILDMKRRFVRFISHEIRTPLNTVCVGLELLERELRTDTSKGRKEKDDAAFAPCTEDIDFWHTVTLDVKENAAIAVSILNDMLNYDKLETKTLEIESEEVNAVSLVEQTVHQFQLQAIDREVDLALTFSDPERNKSVFGFSSQSSASEAVELNASLRDIENNNLCVIGDEVRLSQVFRNVISNALKFTPRNGKIEVSVTHVVNGLPSAEDVVVMGRPIEHDRRRGSLLICISDTGVGLTKEQLERLFGEGVQFDANKLQHGGGSGLGLNIAKGIVELHNGSIKATSEGHGHGTTFVIELPLYEITCKDGYYEEEMSKTESPTDVGSETEAEPCGLKQRRILVVEDALSSRKMLIRLLERDGHVCVGACNGRDAVEMIEQDMEASRLDMSVSLIGTGNTMPSHVKFDTILMDYEMPFMNGPSATRHIRDIGYTGTIIGVTGNVLMEDVEHFKSCGADEVLAKPISMDRLREYWMQHRFEK